MTSIKEQSAAVSAAAATRLPQAVAAAFGADLERHRAGGVPDGAVVCGDVVPDVTLRDATGNDVLLSTLGGPTVLVFYRGGWCPHCSVALRTYQQELLPELQRFGARLVAISPQAPDASLSFAEKAELSFTVLSDPGAGLARQLGLAFSPDEEVLSAQRSLGLDIRAGNADASTTLPLPTVLVLDADRVVHFADTTPVITQRTEVATILTALQNLEQRPSTTD